MNTPNLRRLGRENKRFVRPASIVEKLFRTTHLSSFDSSSGGEGGVWINPEASGESLTLGELLDVDVLPEGVAVMRVGAAFVDHK